MVFKVKSSAAKPTVVPDGEWPSPRLLRISSHTYMLVAGSSDFGAFCPKHVLSERIYSLRYVIKVKLVSHICSA